MRIECKICGKDLTRETIKMFEGKIERVRCTCVKSYVSFTPNKYLYKRYKRENINNQYGSVDSINISNYVSVQCIE